MRGLQVNYCPIEVISRQNGGIIKIKFTVYTLYSTVGIPTVAGESAVYEQAKFTNGSITAVKKSLKIPTSCCSSSSKTATNSQKMFDSMYVRV